MIDGAIYQQRIRTRYYYPIFGAIPNDELSLCEYQAVFGPPLLQLLAADVRNFIEVAFR